MIEVLWGNRKLFSKYILFVGIIAYVFFGG